MAVWAIAAAAVSAIAGAGSSLMKSNAEIKQLKQQAALKNLEGDIYEKNAAAQSYADSYNEDIAREQRDIELSRLRASTAQSGLSGGTLIDVQMRSEREAELDDIMTRYNNHTKYKATMYEAQKARQEASQLLDNARTVKKTRWINAILGGVSSGASVGASGGIFN